MAINTNKTKIIVKKILMLLFIIPFAGITGILVLVLGYFATEPVINFIEHDSINKIDKNTKALYDQLKKVADKGDDFKYKRACETEHDLGGEFPTGMYVCRVIISLQKNTSDVKDIQKIQTKYLPIIDKSKTLTLYPMRSNGASVDFGQDFITGWFEKSYLDNSTNADCYYNLHLYQSVDSLDLNANFSGREIIGGIGEIRLQYLCETKTHAAWFQEVSSLEEIGE